jgi:hypothetical protein
MRDSLFKRLASDDRSGKHDQTDERSHFVFAPSSTM